MIRLRHLPFAALALLALPAIAATMAEPPISIPYKDASLKDPVVAAYWADYLPDIQKAGDGREKVWVGKIQVEGGPDMVFTYLQSNVFCGMQNCPVRLFEDDKLVQEFDVCTAPSDEQVTSDGLQLISCGVIHDISRQAGTPASSSAE